MGTKEIFALDIGTRKIAGLLMSPGGEGFVIKHACLHEQLPNAMADGQIHQIEAVAKVIGNIKADLEGKIGAPLKTAAVAAAGRSLLTQRGISDKKLNPNERLSFQGVRALELEAVLDAVQNLSATASSGVMDSYLCVGYSVVQHYLDGEPIGALENHQGNEAKVEIIATFLPRIVIDSLATALEQGGLKMESLTLEPIAAMHLVVPPTMRMLNIALVDVGAGTSDIAIAAEGTIRAYGMVSYAGDAITRAIADHYLLDTAVAEVVKLKLDPHSPVHSRDVFGNNLTLDYQDVLEVIKPSVKTLAAKIAGEIIKLNGTEPKGVILVGGGSLTPGLAPLLAQELNLPENLVRIRDRDSLDTIQGCPEFSGPEIITPIGIGCTHLDMRSMQLTHVRINGRSVQFLQMTSSTIGDALLQGGLNPGDFLGRPGPAITVELNGRCIPIPGTLGEGGLIFRNGEPALLDTAIEEGDEITLKPGKPGLAPQVSLGEFTEATTACFNLNLNNSPLKVEPMVKVNGEIKALDYILQDRDQISFKPITTFRELLRSLQIPIRQDLEIKLNGEDYCLTQEIQLIINEKPSHLDTPLQNGLIARYFRKPKTIRDLWIAKEKDMEIPTITVKINGGDYELSPKTISPFVNGEEVTLDYVLKSGDVVEYKPQQGGAVDSYIITDLFRDYQPEEAFLERGGQILVNGSEAGFTTPIKHGDVVELRPYGRGIANS